MKRVLALILPFIVIGCIKENLSHCPNWGRYKVAFIEGNTPPQVVESTQQLYLIYQSSKESSEKGIKRYRLQVGKDRYEGEEPLFLPSHLFTFYSLLTIPSATEGEGEKENSSGEDASNEKLLKNGEYYLYSRFEGRVLKDSLNLFTLNHSLLNAIVVIEPLISSTNSEELILLEITPPIEEEAIVDLFTGLCGREGSVTPFFEICRCRDSSQEWYYPCNPLVAGSSITIRATLSNLATKECRVLYCRVSLPMGLEGGKIHRFNLSITPIEMAVEAVGIWDWEEYFHHLIVEYKPLNLRV